MNSLQRAASFVIHRVDADLWVDAPYRERVYSLVEKGIGGIGVFAGELEQTARMIEDIQRAAGGRLLVGADFEHGLAMRIRDAVAFPRSMALGRLDGEQTKEIAGLIATQARALGVHWIWAPVCDVQSNPQNPIVGTRAFGTEADTVARHAAAWIDGCQSAGVIACAKHVPGHGDTVVDSHVALPTIHVSDGVAREREFVPFTAAVAAGVKSLMVGHLLVPFLDASLPASLSPIVISELVRNQWSYQGFVVTDALDMGAITGSYSSGDAAVMSFVAGADGVLMPSSTESAILALAAAIEDGEVTEARLSQSEQRWTALRSSIDVNHAQSTPVDNNTAAFVALRAARNAMDVRGRGTAIDVRQYRNAVMLAAIHEADTETATTFFRYVAQSVENDIDFGFIDGTMTDEDLELLTASIGQVDALYVVFVSRPTAGRNPVPGRNQLPRIVTALRGDRPLIIVHLGDEGIHTDVLADAYVVTYSETDPSLAAAALRCAGRDAL